MIRTPYSSHTTQSGNTIYLIVGVILIAAVVALAVFSNHVIAQNGDDPVAEESVADAGGDDERVSFDPETGPEEPVTVGETTIMPGNPVVATAGDIAIRRSEVLNFIAQLPPQMRQQEIEDLFPLAVDQTINAKLLEQNALREGIQNERMVQRQIEQATENIIRTVYVQRLIAQEFSDEQINEAYRAYIATLPEQQETRARHILVDSEEKANELIAELDEGADFAELAQEHSTGPTGPNGGDLGFFTREQMVPTFSEFAFSIEPGEYGKEPVQTQFGWHVVKVEERRIQPKPELEELREVILDELRRELLDEQLQSWRNELSIETFDINGDPVPAAAEGGEGEQEG